MMSGLSMSQEAIQVRGARVNNLKNVSFSIPINQLTVVTGLDSHPAQPGADDDDNVSDAEHYVRGDDGMHPELESEETE